MKSLRASASPGTLAGLLRQQAWLRACLMLFLRLAHAALVLVQLLQRPAWMALCCFLLVRAEPAAGRAPLPTSQPARHANAVKIMAIQLCHATFIQLKLSHLPLTSKSQPKAELLTGKAGCVRLPL